MNLHPEDAQADQDREAEMIDEIRSDICNRHFIRWDGRLNPLGNGM